MLSARALRVTLAKKRFIWQRSTLPSQNSSLSRANMDTSNKIRVVPQSTFRITRTDSGGVRDPSDPKHYPALGGTEGAVGTAASKRTLPKLESFRDTLVSPIEMPKLRIGTEGSFGASPPTDVTASPTIPANRGEPKDEPVQGGVGGAGDVGSPTPGQQVS